MVITPSKLLALCLVVIYASAAIVSSGLIALQGVAMVLLPPLCLIWFAESLSEFTGYVGKGGNIDQASPEFLVAGFGWLVLLGLPVYLFLAA